MAEEKLVKPNIAAEKPVFSWQSPEFIRYKRDAKWFVYVVLIALVLIIILCFLKQWSGAALVLVAAVVFIILSETKPKTQNCSIYPSGILINQSVYDYSQFKSFWITLGDLPKANLQLTGRFAGAISMPLGNEDVEQIRLYLTKHLPEEERKGEDVIDIINRYLHF